MATLLLQAPYAEASTREKIKKIVSSQITFDPDVITPTEYIQQYVLDSIAEWQKRGRYEPTADYRQRVTEANRAIEVERLMEKAEGDYIFRYFNKSLNPILTEYDPDNESFLFVVNDIDTIIVPVPLSVAPSFEKSWTIDYSKNVYYVDAVDDVVRVKRLVFNSNGQNYIYDNSQSVTFAQTEIDLVMPDIVLDLTADEREEYVAQQTIQRNTVTVGRSDVDVNIPKSNRTASKTFAVIIANETYRREVSVQYALNDGRTFKEYCNQTFGLPSNHIHLVENATLNDIRHEIKWITDIMTTQKGEANIIFYYAGHGIPDESSRKSYLLPTDGYGADPQTAYSLDELYSTLGSIPAESVTYFIDACFSGSKREEGMLASARAVSIKARAGELQGNSVVFSAATDDQTAYPYKEKQHGLFTYFLLKKLQETSGNVNLKELGDYISTNVSQTSVITNSKLQTPSVTASGTLGTTWQEWTLR